jgi:hypothetical protein
MRQVWHVTPGRSRSRSRRNEIWNCYLALFCQVEVSRGSSSLK